MSKARESSSPPLPRVSEYFAVVGTQPSNGSVSVPIPRGCLRCDKSLLDIEEPEEKEGGRGQSPVDFSDSESDIQSDTCELTISDVSSGFSAKVPKIEEAPQYCAVSLREVHRMAIVEIGIVFTDKGEKVPEGYEVLSKTVSGDFDADLNAGLSSYETLIVFKRRGSTGRPDHITDLQLVTWSSSKAPAGYTVLKNTVSGPNIHDASLTRGTYGQSMYLCYSRNSNWNSEETVYNGQTSIGDIIVVNKSKGEYPPHDAEMLNKNVNRGTMSGNDVYIGIIKNKPTGICDIPYESFTIDRYPQADYPDFSLPVNELPMFIFPHGLHLLRRPHTDAPMPSFFPFVFTGLSGERIHVACLTFYEEVGEEVVEKLRVRHNRIHATFSQELEELRGSSRNFKEEERDNKSESSNKYTPKYGIYAPKCVTIISRFPFYRALRRFLRQLYRISLSAAPAPLERYISYMVTWLPVPKSGGRAFHVHLESPTLDGDGKAGYSLAPIALALPPLRSLPSMDLDFNGPFRSLNVTNILNIFALLLQESQLLFLSTRASLVTEVCETFLSLLFPLKWQCCYVPRLPDELAACLDYPGGFVLGMHLVHNEGRRENAEMRKGKEREGVDVNEFLSNLSLQETVHVVDLDLGTVSRAGGSGKLGGSMFRTQPYKSLPTVPMNALKRKLEDELKRVNMVAGRGDGLMDYDSAFEFAPTPDIQEKMAAHGITEESMNADVIRDAFLVFMADTIGTYQHHIIPPKMQKGKDKFHGGDLNNFLNVTELLADADREDKMSSGGGGRHEFLKTLCETQMFSCLVQQRTESSVNDNQLVFFEEVVNLFHRIKAQLDMDSDDEAYEDLTTTSRNDNRPDIKFSTPQKKALATLFSTKESIKNMQYLVKGVREKGEKDNNFGDDSTISGSKPSGLLLQLVHEELGNFLKGNDFKALDEGLISERISEADGRPSEDLVEPPAIPTPAFLNSSREDKGCDADTSVSVSKRKPLEIPGPSSDGIAEKVREANGDAPRRRAETATAERQWSYPMGWPTPLEPSFFEYPLKSLPPLLVHLRSQAIEQTHQNKRLILTRSADEVVRSGLDYNMTESIHSCVQVYGCFFLCVPTHLAHLQDAPVRTLNRLFLRSLGALKRIDFIAGRGGLEYTDEAMWRSLLIGAGRIGGVKMAEVSSGLFAEMKRAGITPNAVTYGLYTQALAVNDFKSKKGKKGREEAPLMRGTSVGTFADRSVASTTTSASVFVSKWEDAEDEEFTSLEVEGFNWRVEKCLQGRGRGLTNKAKSIGGFDDGGEEGGGRMVQSERTLSATSPPSPPARISSFGSSSYDYDGARFGSMAPTFLGGVGMWLTCVCKACGKTMLEEDILSSLQVSGTGLAQKIECKCGEDLEPELNFNVQHIKVGGGRDKGVGSPGMNCAGPDTGVLRQPITGLGSLSGVEGAVYYEGAGASMDPSLVSLMEKTGGKRRLMSPVVVRSRLERILIRDGEHKMTRENLMKEEDGEVYWNLVWYCGRFGLPVPLAFNEGDGQDGSVGDENIVKEMTVVGLNETIVMNKLENQLMRKGGWGGDQETQGAGGGEQWGAEINSSSSGLSVDEDYEFEGWNIKIEWLFNGINDDEKAGLTQVRNVLVTGNKEGTVPEGGWTVEVGGGEKGDGEGVKRNSLLRRLSLGGGGGEGGGGERRNSVGAKDPNKLPTAGKRVHDAIQLCCKFRSNQTFRSPSEFPELSNLYHILLLIVGTYDPSGMKVVNMDLSSKDYKSEFDKLYMRAISRLSLMQQEQLDQSDRDLHGDISTKRSAEFRNALGFL